MISTTENADVKDRYQTLQVGAKDGAGEGMMAIQGYASLEAEEITNNTHRQVIKRPSQGPSNNAATINIQKKQFPGQPQIPRHGSKRRSTMTQRDPNLRNYADAGIGQRKHSGRVLNQLGDADHGSNSYRTLGSLDNLSYAMERGTNTQFMAKLTNDNSRRKSQSNPRQKFAVSGRIGTDTVVNAQNNR